MYTFSIGYGKIQKIGSDSQNAQNSVECLKFPKLLRMSQIPEKWLEYLELCGESCKFPENASNFPKLPRMPRIFGKWSRMFQIVRSRYAYLHDVFTELLIYTHKCTIIYHHAPNLT